MKILQSLSGLWSMTTYTVMQVKDKWSPRTITVVGALIDSIKYIYDAVSKQNYCFFTRTQRDRKQNCYVFRGSQDGCAGVVNPVKAKAVWKTLQGRRPNGIEFNEQKLDISIKGGTCTAMSLEFLDSYFKEKKLYQLQSDQKSDGLLHHIRQLGKNFGTSSDEMRDRQMAFNSIEVKKTDDTLDYSQNKVQALANYHLFKIDHSSEEIDTGEEFDKSRFKEKFDNLPEGAFFVRILKPEDNEKLEEHGHSLVYIKEQGLHLLYDPNSGLKNLSASDDGPFRVVCKSFKKCFEDFEINKARFYRLRPQVKRVYAPVVAKL